MMVKVVVPAFVVRFVAEEWDQQHVLAMILGVEIHPILTIRLKKFILLVVMAHVQMFPVAQIPVHKVMTLVRT
ncbi:MAG: hypothetical protein CME98_25255 [Hyphomonas sp.]|jgi:hypothetical protein|nr:hypothetical protein [Hyphomonas sp.]